MLRQHHMLKRVLNSGRERRAGGLFVYLFCLFELTREEVGERKEPKYIYILNSINKSQFVCEGRMGAWVGAGV